MYKIIDSEDRPRYEDGDLEFILLPNQIPIFWEAIKYAYVRSGDYKEEHIPILLHILLVNLLCGNSLIAVVLDKDRQLASIVIFNIVEELITKDKSLFIEGFYSYKPASEEEWAAKIMKLVTFAKREGCKRLKGNTGNKKLHEIINKQGVIEISRCYSLEL
jgi:hypothetical protein